MPDPTPLDRAHAEMAAAPDDETPRLRFYERLADGELFMMLREEAKEDKIEPRLFPLDDGDYVLVYDREDRLARFAGGPTPYAALSGRRVVAMLAGKGIGLGLNLGEAPSEMLLPPEVVDWLAETLSHRPAETSARPQDIAPPNDLPEALLTSLDTKVALAQGLASMAYLASVTYQTGARGHLLAFIDPAPGAEEALVQATNEVLTFSGLAAGAIDVAFFPSSHVVSARLARVALRFDIPPAPEEATPVAPGSDPAKPPRLR
ncbi:MAG: SseB family protein [Pseudomonadota bacterium]